MLGLLNWLLGIFGLVVISKHEYRQLHTRVEYTEVLHRQFVRRTGDEVMEKFQSLVDFLEGKTPKWNYKLQCLPHIDLFGAATRIAEIKQSAIVREDVVEDVK
jgi:hypothetical protein